MTEKNAIIDKIWESSAHGTERIDIENAFNAGTDFNTADPMSLAYIIKGFWGQVHGNDIDVSKSEEITGYGETGLVQRLIDLALLDDKLWASLALEEVSFVWCYEISEPFGEALAMHLLSNPELPNDEHAAIMLRGIYDTAVASREGLAS